VIAQDDGVGLRTTGRLWPRTCLSTGVYPYEVHMNTSVRRALSSALLAIVAVSGCKTFSAMSNKEQGAVIGVATGAAVGAVVGNATGSTARGAIIGAAVGGAAGAVIGHQMDQKAKEITASVPGATVTRVGEGLVVTFESGLLFPFDSDKLQPEARRNLDSLAAHLASFGDSKMLLVGHTDSVGTATYNQQLSERRAIAVASHLGSRGVSSNRFSITGRGEAEPIAANETDAGRQVNRRVEIAITAGDQMKAAAKSGGSE
jgi:outer membrane protein OmpA-like peptidoglycan-associated protein